ncbi:MAG: SDR family NAD(P)-dependent oxidoreductase, partial [Stackebrandtia sp.]
ESAAEGGMYCKWGGFLEDVDHFDPLFFNISPREAELMDPQERIFLQTAWHTFEDAGYPPYRLGEPGRQGDRAVGVFVGVTTQSYLLWGPDQRRAGNTGIPTSTAWSIANRVSYCLDLRGPSMPVDTACASSLSAVHLAWESLARGECRMALVGAVNLYLHPSKYEWLCQMQMLSRTGRCHTFGDRADGFVPGEGVGAILLKPLAAAVADGDKILGVVCGTAVNHGGRTSGFTVPNPVAQAELIRSALHRAGIRADEIGYVEAHGTGTALGDPIEIAGLEKAFSTGVRSGSCAIGSVKTNIGHLESAAGIAGLTKVLLQMRHRHLVPSLHAERENPRINFAGTPFRVQSSLSAWPRKLADGEDTPLPRRAGVSSFGAGGANAHVVIEEYEGPAARGADSAGEHLVPLSAYDAERLREHCRNVARTLRDRAGDIALADVAYQLQVRREPLRERLAILAGSIPELIEQLEAAGAGRTLGDRGWQADPVSRRGRPADTGTTGEDIERALATRDLAAMGALWVAGAAVPWERLHTAPPRHVELPGYPFAKESYWLPPAAEYPGGPAAPRGDLDGHPFIASSGDDPSSLGVEFTGAEFFLADHRVRGVPIFPAVGYLEMVRAALEQRGKRVVRIRNNVWSSAITVAAPMEVRLDVASTDEAADYTIYSLSPDGARTVHGEGKVDTVSRENLFDDESVDLDAVRNRCGTRVGPAEFYPRIHELGLQLGTSYQGIEMLHVGDGEALSQVRLPAHLAEAADKFVLHPSIFDSALQGSLWLIDRRENADRLHLPFTIGALELHGAVPRRCFSHVVLRSWTANAKKFDIRITDEQGRVVLRVRDFWLRPSQEATQRTVNSAIPGVFFRPDWVPCPVAGPAVGAERRTDQSDPIFFFAPTMRAGQLLGAQAVAAGRTSCPIIVIPGEEFRALPEKIYEVRPDCADDLEQLFSSVPDSTRQDVVYAWPRSVFDGRPEGLRRQLDEGLAPLFLIVRTLLRAKRRVPTRLLCVFPGDATGQPGYEALGGLLRTAGRESTQFAYRLVEFPAELLATLDDGSREAAAQLLLSELSDLGERDHEVCHRGGARRSKRWSEFLPPATGSSSLREHGVYLITGGVGGLGLTLAGHLAARARARVVLIGRSSPGERADTAVARVRDAGGDACYVQADVATPEGAARAVAAAKAAYGVIHGVFHCAGVLDDGYLVHQKLDRIEAVLAPKLWGAVHLDMATRAEPLEFLVFFSSVAGAFGTVGQSGYAYANSFLDTFASWREERRRLGRRSGKTLSLAWPL